MARGHSESAHNVLVDDHPVGPRTTRKVADLHTWSKSLVSSDNVDVGDASGEMGDEMPLPQQAVCTSARILFRRCGATKALCLACE